HHTCLPSPYLIVRSSVLRLCPPHSSPPFPYTTLFRSLEATITAVEAYREAITDFFASMPAAEWATSLPGGRSGTTVPQLYAELGDRKSTRLNSSHQIISYAVFCLKKKKHLIVRLMLLS